MRRLLALAAIFLPFVFSAAAPPDETQAPRIMGFTDQSARAERDWEQKFRALPKAELEKQYSERLAARPHHVGSPYDKDNAEWLLGLFKSWGLDAQIENFDVLMPTPKERLVEMTEPPKFTLKLQEP